MSKEVMAIFDKALANETDAKEIADYCGLDYTVDDIAHIASILAEQEQAARADEREKIIKRLLDCEKETQWFSKETAEAYVHAAKIVELMGTKTGG